MNDKLLHFINRSIKPRGVIYVGANDGEEFVQCKEHGITNLLAFEPLSAPYKRLRAAHPDVLAFKLGLGSNNAIVKMEVTENDKASSTLQRVPVDNWQEHEVFKDWNMGQWPIVGTEKVEVVAFVDFAEQQGINVDDYNLLFMDVQGMELDALKGFDGYLDNFDGICVELSENPVYLGEAPASEVINYLEGWDFKQDSPVRKHDDVLFVRKEPA